MIKAKIYRNDKGEDICNVRIKDEWGDSESTLLHLFTQLNELNATVLDSFVKSEFDPREISDYVHLTWFDALISFRKKYNVNVSHNP